MCPIVPAVVGRIKPILTTCFALLRHTEAKGFSFPHESQVWPFAGQVFPGGWLGYPQLPQFGSSYSSHGVRERIRWLALSRWLGVTLYTWFEDWREGVPPRFVY